MLLTSVILILQETLEAALLVSMLAVVSLHLGRRPSWLAWGAAAGGLLAWLYAANIRQVSEWFDYVGQEVVNASLQVAITALLLPLVWIVAKAMQRPSPPSGPGSRPGGRSLAVLSASAVTLAVTREGSEILVFLGGFLGQQEQVQALLVGSTIGFGIGISVGVLLFYALLPLRGARGRWVPLLLLALFGGNMLAQAALYLAQADWLQSGPALWDSSAWLPEHSVAGRLLYALIGYESSPSTAQVTSYIAGTAALLAAALLGRRAA